MIEINVKIKLQKVFKQLNRTKIIATLGPQPANSSAIRSLILSGVNVFRVNMSHIHHLDDLSDIIQIVRSTSDDLNKQIGVMMDIAGPKIRVDSKSDEIKVKKGDILTIGYKESDITINLNPSFKKIVTLKKIVAPQFFPALVALATE